MWGGGPIPSGFTEGSHSSNPSCVTGNLLEGEAPSAIVWQVQGTRRPPFLHVFRAAAQSPGPEARVELQRGPSTRRPQPPHHPPPRLHSFCSHGPSCWPGGQGQKGPPVCPSPSPRPGDTQASASTSPSEAPPSRASDTRRPQELGLAAASNTSGGAGAQALWALPLLRAPGCCVLADQGHGRLSRPLSHTFSSGCPTQGAAGGFPGGSVLSWQR